MSFSSSCNYFQDDTDDEAPFNSTGRNIILEDYTQRAVLKLYHHVF